jgi:hypothetical protein
MKTVWMTLLASAAIAVGYPAAASAHPDEDESYASDDWNNGGDTYTEFNAEYQHIWAEIEHGVNDGSYTPRQADYFYRQMQGIRARADWQQRRGYGDAGAIQVMLERLHDRMHVYHERSHDHEDRYDGNRGYGYGNANPYRARDNNTYLGLSFGYRH